MGKAGRPIDERLVPAVLVHGLIGTLSDCVLLGAFGPRPVLVPDLLGYGELTDVPPGRITLAAQAGHLLTLLEEEAFGEGRVHLVGHSVGGAVAALVAHERPERVASLTSVEGNFTLEDAFLSGRIARMSAEEAEGMMEADRADPAAWLERAGVAPSEGRLATARRWLAHQPASTVQAMARSVVETTAELDYLRKDRAVMGATPVHLVAGERSRGGGTCRIGRSTWRPTRRSYRRPDTS